MSESVCSGHFVPGRLVGLALFASLLGAAALAHAETPEEQGYRIFKGLQDANTGYVDSVQTLQMVLTDKMGGTAERDMRLKSLEGADNEGAKNLIVFDTPRDQKGTALLTWQHKGRDNDQWLYLPALKRVKKIASQNKSGPFMGSEFSFEDVGGQQLDDYTYKWLRQEPCDDQTCDVVEMYPRDENSGYTRVVSWVDGMYRIVKADYFDRKQTHLKSMKATGFKRYLDKFWHPANIEMTNLQTGKSTRLISRDVAFKTGLGESDFTETSLERAR